MIHAGILSDTHLHGIDSNFKELTARAFTNCDIIFHAGDITHPAVLEVFHGKTVQCVHGNMCSASLQKTLPHSRLVSVQGFTIGLCHGAGPRHNIEERMWALFPEADCIIYGHTHQPICRRQGGILFINPGCFQCTSPHGAPASYAILTISETGLTGQLQSIALQH